MGDTLGALSGLRKASSIGPAKVGATELPRTGNRWADAGTVFDLLPEWMQPDLSGYGGTANAAGPVFKATGSVDDALRGVLGEMDRAAAPATRAAARANTAAHHAPRLPIGAPGAPPGRPPLPNTPQPSELYWQRTVNNASGESSASLEAINRLKEMAGKGQKFGVKNRGGQVRELIGADAVDGSMRLNPGEAFGIIENGIWRPY